MVLSLAAQMALAAMLVGSSLIYLLVGTPEEQWRARGALVGSAVVSAVGVGLMLVWPWPRGGLVDAQWQGQRRRRFGGVRRGDRG